MRLLPPGTRLVVASHNPGKLVEIADLVRPYGLDTVSAGALNVSEPEETETTFVGNARLKALHSARTTGLPALADDSGLEVHTLGGDPGVYSARWAGPSKDFAFAMQKVADALTAKNAWLGTHPTANFTCVLSVAWPDGRSMEFEGKVFGHLVWPGRGTRGFGFDPMFMANGATETYGEMDQQQKHATSHRAQAFKLFVAACLEPTS
jgi:XTP/dITP diphosphohydrolase